MLGVLSQFHVKLNPGENYRVVGNEPAFFIASNWKIASMVTQIEEDESDNGPAKRDPNSDTVVELKSSSSASSRQRSNSLIRNLGIDELRRMSQEHLGSSGKFGALVKRSALASRAFKSKSMKYNRPVGIATASSTISVADIQDLLDDENAWNKHRANEIIVKDIGELKGHVVIFGA